MPASIARRLGLGEIRPTSVTLQMADRSLSYPKGIVEDVLIKVDKFIFPVDFIVLDMEEDRDVPIILGRPFLATGRALIDVQAGKLTMRVNNQEVTFDIYSPLKQPDAEAVMAVSFCKDILDDVVEEMFILTQSTDAVEVALVAESDQLGAGNEAFMEAVMALDALPRFRGFRFESLDLPMGYSKDLKPSVEDPPSLEMKQLPSHLKYQFLGDNYSLPIIISATLTAT